MLTWPADLPLAVPVGGYARGFGDGRIRTETDSGPPRTRRRYSSVIRPVSVALIVDINGLARFDAFWTDETASGVLPFTFPNLWYDQRVLETAAGEPLTDELDRELRVRALDIVKFGDDAPSPPVDLGRNRKRIAFSLWVMP